MGPELNVDAVITRRLGWGLNVPAAWLEWSTVDRVFVTLSITAVSAVYWTLSSSLFAASLCAVMTTASLAMHARLAVGVFHAVVLVLLSGAGLAALGAPLGLVATAVIVSLMGLSVIARFGQRSRLLRVGAGLGILAALTTAAGFFAGEVLPWPVLAREGAAVACGGFASVLLMLAIDPVLDALFGHSSRLTLSEWLSLEHPLLRELARTAPGTLQHSVNVGVLAAAAARSIGADALLARVGGLYHDVGKSTAPGYFIENQDGTNPHDQLDPHDSARILRAHVSDGVERVLAHGMGERVAAFVREHHGTSAMRLLQAKVGESDGATRDDLTFRYPGPRPRSRETGILMVADQVEATARSAPPADLRASRELVHRTIERVMADGELAQCGLTARHLADIETSLAGTVHAMYHRRLIYPSAPSARPSRSGSTASG